MILKYKKLSRKIFLYDVSNMIETTFFSEVNKKIQTYGVISYFTDSKNNIARLITPQKRLIFTVISRN